MHLHTFTHADTTYRIALADAIRRPMGVVPASAEGLITAADLTAAETRRQPTPTAHDGV